MKVQTEESSIHYCNCGRIQTWFTANNYPAATVSGSVIVLSQPNQIKKCTAFLFCMCGQQIMEVTPHISQSTCRIFLTAMLTRPNTNPTQMHVKSDAELMFY